MRGIVFWRPIENEKPLTHMPLCVLDPNSLTRDDCVNSQQYGLAHFGPSQSLNLKYNENHRWFFYPNMTKDEVLVFT